MSTSDGAWVARARFAAELGSPIPTKQVMPSRSARAADTVIISSAVYVISPPEGGPGGVWGGGGAPPPGRGGAGGGSSPPRERSHRVKLSRSLAMASQAT